MPQYTYEYNNQPENLTLERNGEHEYRATLPDGTVQTFEATALGDGVWRISVNGQAHIVRVASAGTERYIHTSGQHYVVSRTDSTSKRRKSLAGKGDLNAQMPGQVTDVRVSEGQSVTSGQVLLIMEAMKMEIRVTAPQDGTIKRLNVQKGQVVERGQALIEMTFETA